MQTIYIYIYINIKISYSEAIFINHIFSVIMYVHKDNQLSIQLYSERNTKKALKEFKELKQ